MLITDGADAAAILESAGWELKPEGACRGELCVPLGTATGIDDIADCLGMPIVRDERHGLASLGPATLGGRALTTAHAPLIELPLVQSDDVWRLADQRGRRTVIVAWAPW